MKTCQYCAEEIQDAAIVCKHCGRDVTAPPTSARDMLLAKPQMDKTGRAGWMIAIIVAVLVVIVVGANMSSPSPEQMKTLNVSLAVSDDAIRITNTGSGDAVGVTITAYINGSPPFAYKAEATMPALGESVQIPLRTFSKKSGERFIPSMHAVTVVWIGGASYDYRSFDVK